MGSSPTARTTSEQTALHCVNRHSRKAVPVDIRSAPFAPPFKSEPAALGFGFVFLCWRLGGGKFRRLFCEAKKDVIHSVTSVPPFKTEAEGFGFVFLWGCLLVSVPPFKSEAGGFGFVFGGGICSVTSVPPFKPEAVGFGFGVCGLGFAAVIFFDCSEEGFAVFGGLDFADAGDVQELVHVPGRAGGHVH